MSTPHAEYDKQRAQLLSELGQIAPPPTLSRLSKLIRPAIALQSVKAFDEEEYLNLEMNARASKLGGTPHLPVGLKWPHCNGKPLSFVAQIDLEEVAPFDLDNHLPEKGVLLFWMNVEMGIQEKFGACRVVHVRDEKLQKPSKGAPEGVQEFSLAQLKPQVWASMPNVEGNIEFYDENGIEDNELSSVLSDCIFSHNELVYGHQMLGFPENIQYDVRAETSCAWNKFLQCKQARTLGLSKHSDTTEWTDWELLLQIGGDIKAKFMWGNGGTIYFLIRHVDLKAKRFDRCWFIFQCG